MRKWRCDPPSPQVAPHVDKFEALYETVVKNSLLALGKVLQFYSTGPSDVDDEPNIVAMKAKYSEEFEQVIVTFQGGLNYLDPNSHAKPGASLLANKIVYDLAVCLLDGP
eukprot:1235187-Pyramimonas_sp.AAC.4